MSEAIGSETRLRLSDDVTFQSLGQAQETVVLSLTSGHLYTCNETTKAFLEALDGRRSFSRVVDLLEEQFEVGREKLQRDLAGLAEELLKEGLIVALEPGGD
jgi:hypothetical protein